MPSHPTASTWTWLPAYEIDRRSVRTIRAKMNPDVMRGSFQAYAEYLAANPPPPGRFDLVARLVHSQRSGEFFVLATDQLQSTVTRVVDQVGGAGTARRGRSTALEDQGRADDVEIASFVSLLKRVEPLSDSEAERLLEAYESAPAQWWVGVYADAILAALDGAGVRASAALR
jgi:hypothetical protein